MVKPEFFCLFILLYFTYFLLILLKKLNSMEMFGIYWYLNMKKGEESVVTVWKCGQFIQKPIWNLSMKNFDKLLQKFMYPKGSKATCAQSSYGSIVKMVQSLRRFKVTSGSICSKAQMIQGFSVQRADIGSGLKWFQG